MRIAIEKIHQVHNDSTSAMRTHRGKIREAIAAADTESTTDDASDPYCNARASL